MPPPNGLLLQGPQQPVIQQIQVSQPFNDVQMVALLAVWCPGNDAKCKVHKAQDIYAEAFREKGRFSQMIDRIKAGEE